MPSKYEPGQISTYRNLPEKTKRQIKYAASHLGLTRGALIASAVDAFLSKLASEGRLPEHLTNLVALEEMARQQGAPRANRPPDGGGDDGCNTPQSSTRSDPPTPADAGVQAYLQALSQARPGPSPELVELEARLAERRAIRDQIMGRTPGGFRR